MKVGKNLRGLWQNQIGLGVTRLRLIALSCIKASQPLNLIEMTHRAYVSSEHFTMTRTHMTYLFKNLKICEAVFVIPNRNTTLAK